MNKVRTIVIDGVEIQTSLSAVEIASLPIKCAELKQENQELKEKIDGVYEERTYLYNKLSMENKQLISKLDRYDAIVEERDKYKEVIDKAINLNEQIKHFVYENLLEENIIGSKIIYEYVEKQNKILKEAE